MRTKQPIKSDGRVTSRFRTCSGSFHSVPEGVFWRRRLSIIGTSSFEAYQVCRGQP